MTRFPYAGLPTCQIWKRAVADAGAQSVDPQIPGRFRISKTTPVGSAGSCFALRIADALRDEGYAYLVTEPPMPGSSAGYSARYGDIYTALQLAQLAQRCAGTFSPSEPAWLANGRYHDPFRPRVEAGGFATVADLEADRRAHLAATRRVFAESDVFIFTLGLTETWVSRADGSAFPLCPGAGIGTFDDDRYAFRNLNVDENVAALEIFLDVVWSLNPKLRVLLTVSPVPLAATMEARHVIAATGYSKAVLRVVAETMRARHERVDYFAAYEIVTAPAGGGALSFGPDGREVLDTAVARVKHSFFRAFGEPTAAAEPDTSMAAAVKNPAGPVTNLPTPPSSAKLPVMELSMSAVDAAATAPRSPNDPCDEAYLASFIARS